VTAAARQPAAPEHEVAARLAALDAASLATALDAGGYAVVPALLSAEECASLAAQYDDASLFRSRGVMARHGYGQGEYQYFAYPLPPLVAALRGGLYALLAPIANRWNAAMHSDVRYPPDHAGFRERCHRAGQLRPTPLLLRYRAGDYNRLHQDLYCEHVFPLQATVLLSRPASDREQGDFTGGEFVLVEQRARMQSRAEVVPLGQGDAVVFAVNQRPVTSARGFTRVAMRHGVSKLRSGARMTLGVIFHDARQAG
jgi:uncharacterized protein